MQKYENQLLIKQQQFKKKKFNTQDICEVLNLIFHCINTKYLSGTENY